MPAPPGLIVPSDRLWVPRRFAPAPRRQSPAALRELARWRRTLPAYNAGKLRMRADGKVSRRPVGAAHGGKLVTGAEGSPCCCGGGVCPYCATTPAAISLNLTAPLCQGIRSLCVGVCATSGGGTTCYHQPCEWTGAAAHFSLGECIPLATQPIGLYEGCCYEKYLTLAELNLAITTYSTDEATGLPDLATAADVSSSMEIYILVCRYGETVLPDLSFPAGWSVRAELQESRAHIAANPDVPIWVASPSGGDYQSYARSYGSGGCNRSAPGFPNTNLRDYRTGEDVGGFVPSQTLFLTGAVPDPADPTNRDCLADAYGDLYPVDGVLNGPFDCSTYAPDYGYPALVDYTGSSTLIQPAEIFCTEGGGI